MLYNTPEFMCEGLSYDGAGSAHPDSPKPGVVRQTLQGHEEIVDAGFRLHILHVHGLQGSKCRTSHRLLVGCRVQAVLE